MICAMLKLSGIKPAKLDIVILETVNLALLALLFLCRGLAAVSIIFAPAVPVLIALAYTDMRIMKIFNKHVSVIFAIALLNLIISFDLGLCKDALLGMLLGGGFFYILALVSKMGGGDIKLMGALGLLMGIESIFFVIMTAFISAGTYALTALILKKKTRKSHIPLGPFISFGAYLVFIFGDGLLPKL